MAWGKRKPAKADLNVLYMPIQKILVMRGSRPLLRKGCPAPWLRPKASRPLLLLLLLLVLLVLLVLVLLLVVLLK